MSTRCKHSQGFSLVELLVGISLMSGLALVFAHINKVQAINQKKAETSLEFTSISAHIGQSLLNGQSCINTIGQGNELIEGMQFDSIKNRLDRDIYSVGKNYGNNAIRVESIRLKNISMSNGFGEANIQVDFKRLSRLLKGNKFKSHDFPIKIRVDSDNNLLNCYSSVENAVETAIKESCESLGGRLDNTTNLCNLSQFNPATLKERFHAVSTKYLDDYSNNRMIDVLDSRYINFKTPMECPNGHYLKRINSDGSLGCEELPTSTPQNCAWTEPVRGGWPQEVVASCPNSKKLEGHSTKKLLGNHHIVEKEITTSTVSIRTGGSGANSLYEVKAYCCD